MIDIERNEEFEAYKARCIEMVPARLAMSGQPRMLKAGCSIDKLSILLLNARGETISHLENNITLVLEIVHLKVSTPICFPLLLTNLLFVDRIIRTTLHARKHLRFATRRLPFKMLDYKLNCSSVVEYIDSLVQAMRLRASV